MGRLAALCLVLGGMVGAVAGAAGQRPPDDAEAPRSLRMDGDLSFADHERLLERTFEVPAGTRRVEVALAYTGAEERRTVVDLGLRGPAGLRGWSGGRTRHIEVSAVSATAGYLPGPLEPGTWAVLLGVPNIRPDSRDHYTLIITLHETDLAPPTRVLREEPGWYVGDLHLHSGHSDGTVRTAGGARIGAPVHQVLSRAAAAGLDFVALTDHNTASHWLDVDRLQPAFDRLLLLHGREVTTYRGHANTAGERQYTDFRMAGPDASPADILRPIAEGGAFVSINHPTSPDDERCMGCGWNVANDDVLRQVHGVEVVNGESRAGPLFGWTYWAALLNGGHVVTAVGGSDDHTPDNDEDRRAGTPTTVVWADALSEPAIVEGLKSGRVYVRTRGPDGPALEFTAQIGDAVVPMGAVVSAPSSTSILLQARVTGADGQTLEWIRNGDVEARVLIGETCCARRVEAKPGDWFSVIVRDAGDPTLIGNAVRVGARLPGEPRVPASSGERRRRQ